MKYLNFALLSTSFCWIFSPDGLVLLGNLAGRGGYGFLSVMLVVLVLYICIAKIYRAEASSPLPPQRTSLGLHLLMALSLACYFGLAVFLPTGALVTAGFTFNETFLYWFPNFGFSFLLLGIILVCHLINLRVAQYLQMASVGTALACLSILAIAGLLQGPTLPPGETEKLIMTWRDWHYLLAATPLLFLGIMDEKPAPLVGSVSAERGRSHLVPLLIATVLLGLWVAASLFHVPQSKLAGSTIPYIFSAREILGQTGRVLIGLTIISGALALLNGLLMLFQAELLFQLQRLELRQPLAVTLQRFSALLVCLTIGALMAGGLAGYEVLESLITAVLVLWLFLTGLKALNRCVASRPSGLLTAPALLLIASLTLVLTTDIFFTLKTLVILITGSFAVSTVWIRLSR